MSLQNRVKSVMGGLWDLAGVSRSPSPFSDSALDHTKSVYKAVIPKFLYKPPYGYPRFVDIPELRRLAATPFVEMCVNTITDEVTNHNWEIVPRSKDRPVSDALIKDTTDFFDDPNINKESFDSILRKIVRDILTLDSGVMVKVFDGFQDFQELYARDSGTFTLNPDKYGTFADRADFIPYHAMQNMTTEQTREYLKNKPAYFQYGWITGAKPMPFGKREIIYLIRNPQPDSLYGRAPMQVLSDVVQMLVYGIDQNLEYYTDNNIPKGVFRMIGADSDAIRSFKQQWRDITQKKNEVGDWRRNFYKMPIINAEGNFERLQFSNAELELIGQQEWFSKVVWGCYDEETEILTEDGWKYFKDLKDEKVARVNPDGLEIDFVKPIAKQEYDYNGELIHYKTKSCDLMVTPEHKMLQCNDNVFYDGNATWKEKEAREFNRGIIPQAGKWTGNKIKEMKFESNKLKNGGSPNTETFKISGDNFAKFMGIWLSDGWIETSNNRIALCASEVYSENIEIIRKLLADMDVDYKERIMKVTANLKRNKQSKHKLHNFRFSNRAFSAYLAQFGKAYDKYVPKELLNTTPKQINLFLEYFMYGDGSKGYKGRNDRYGSMSKPLMNGLQEMLTKTSISSTLTQNSSNGCWELTARKTKTDKIDKKHYSRIIPKSVSKENYTGKVYDVTLPDYHFLVVRRNGRVSISGNCYGITPSELGFTQDSNRAVEVVQSTLFRRKTILPILNLLEYHLNRELVWSEFSPELKFQFDRYDLNEDLQKHGLYEIQLRTGLRTVNEVRDEQGFEPIEGGDTSKINQPVFNMMKQSGKYPEDYNPDKQKELEQPTQKKSLCLWTENYLSGIRHVEKELDVNIEYKMKPRVQTPHILKAIEEGVSLITDLTEEQRKQVKNILLSVLDTPRSIEDLKHELTEKVGLKEQKASAIVRTESTRIQNAGQLDAYEAQEIPMKKWMSVLDAKTSPLCKKLHEKYNGKPIPLDQSFTATVKQGKRTVKWNGLYPPAHVNCRSMMVGAVKEE